MAKTLVLPEHDGSQRTSLLGRVDLELPREIAHEARGRVRTFALTTVVITFLLGLGWTVAIATGLMELRIAWPLPPGAALACLVGLAMTVASRSERVSDVALIRTVLVLVVVLGFVGAFAHAVYEVNRYGRVSPFGPHVLGIALFSVLIPCPPRSVAITATLAAVAAPAAMLVAHVTGAGRFAWWMLLEYASVPAVAAAASYAVSRVLFRMQSSIAKSRRMGSYELEEMLGAGGMGEVWRARHHMLKRPAAIKLVHPRQLASEPARRQDALERFFREARVTAALESPHTVRLFDFGVTGDKTLYFAMELLDGIDLDHLVERHGALPPARVRSILLQVCDSLAEAHDVGLVHRDIKPANIMVCRQGRMLDVVKLLDFGVVSLQSETAQPADSKLTAAGAIIGTPGYIAPETLGEGSADARADIYSVGCVAYWLLTGKPVFEAPGRMELFAAHLRDEPQ
ncbi:MAG: serine/threonine protein kinase, partial [Deltaproteobacteria bacterium]|nr:serine/threonine protein kinase [Deltaproteobacteria bacterium]